MRGSAMRFHLGFFLTLGSAALLPAQPFRCPPTHLSNSSLHSLRISAPFVRAAQAGSSSAPVQEHLKKAHDFLQHNQPALAIPEFAAVVAADPNNLDAQANLGVLLFFTGQPQQAEPHLRAALAIDPKESKLQMLLGSSEHREGQLESARKDLTAALANVQDPKVRKQAGLEIVEIDTALNDLPAATAVINDLKAAFPTDPEILFAAYRVYTDLAGEALLDLSVVAPNSAQMHQAMAHELIRDRDTKGAIANLRDALKLNPALPGGHFELAELLHSSLQPAEKAEAEQEYKLAIEQQPNDAASLTRLGDIAGEKGDHAEAIARYKQALDAQPEYTDAAIGLAYQLNETGHPDQALPLLLQAIKADPTNLLAHFRLSAVYRRLHRPDDAKREVAEYERLKGIREKMRTIYDTMRMNSPQGADVKE